MQSIELFAGAGGLGLGLHTAGFRPRNVFDFNKWCCESLRVNAKLLSKPDVIYGDVREVDYGNFAGELSLVSGGPPCQPFSTGGRHKAHADVRDMFPEAVRAVRETQPEAFVFENVKGLTREAFRSYFEYIRLQMTYPELTARNEEDWSEHKARLEQHHTSTSKTGLRYNVLVELLDAANYGIPQRRQRVFFVGLRSDIDANWSFPLPTHSSEALAWEKLRGSYWDRHSVPQNERVLPTKCPLHEPHTAPWRTVREVIQKMPSFGSEKAADLNHFFQDGARSYPGHTGSYIDDPAKTLKAGVHGVPGGENMVRFHDGSVRYFSVREAASLQTFPEQFKFSGAWSECMRQIGNAVPVDLATVVGSSLIKHLRER